MSMRDNDELRERIRELEGMLASMLADYSRAATVADGLADSTVYAAGVERWAARLRERGIEAAS